MVFHTPDLDDPSFPSQLSLEKVNIPLLKGLNDCNYGKILKLQNLSSVCAISILLNVLQ